MRKPNVTTQACISRRFSGLNYHPNFPKLNPLLWDSVSDHWGWGASKISTLKYNRQLMHASAPIAAFPVRPNPITKSSGSF